jgi:hypothetical protein
MNSKNGVCVRLPNVQLLYVKSVTRCGNTESTHEGHKTDVFQVAVCILVFYHLERGDGGSTLSK